MGLNDTFLYYGYASDDTTTYAIKLSANVAAEGGFSSQVSPATTKVWPYGARNMRHVLGKDSAGHRTKLPIQTVGQTLYTGGGTFTLNGRTYTVEGQIGEKRKKNHIA